MSGDRHPPACCIATRLVEGSRSPVSPFGSAVARIIGLIQGGRENWVSRPLFCQLRKVTHTRPAPTTARVRGADAGTPQRWNTPTVFARNAAAFRASLHRGKRPLTLSAKELAVSQGVMLSTHYDRRHRLMVLGYLDEDGKLKPEVPAKRGRESGGRILSRGSHVRARGSHLKRYGRSPRSRIAVTETSDPVLGCLRWRVPRAGACGHGIGRS